MATTPEELEQVYASLGTTSAEAEAMSRQAFAEGEPIYDAIMKAFSEQPQRAITSALERALADWALFCAEQEPPPGFPRMSPAQNLQFIAELANMRINAFIEKLQAEHQQES
jgi:hypothetical protein